FDPTLGTTDDLRRLIESAHALGMRVLVDLPLVGCDIHARYVVEQPSWFCLDAEGQMYTGPNEPDMYFFDWANSSLQRYMFYQARVDFACDELAHHHFFHTALNRMTPAELGEWLRDHGSVQPFDVVRVCFTESYNTRLLNSLADGLRGSRISRMLLAGLIFCG